MEGKYLEIFPKKGLDILDRIWNPFEDNSTLLRYLPGVVQGRVETVGGGWTQADADEGGQGGRQAGEVSLQIVLEVDKAGDPSQEMLVHVVLGETAVEDGDVLGAVRDEVELALTEVNLLQEHQEILQSLLQRDSGEKLSGLTVSHLSPSVRSSAGLEEDLGSHGGMDVGQDGSLEGPGGGDGSDL